MDDVQGDGVHHVLNNHSQHSVRPASLLQKNDYTLGDLAARRQQQELRYFQQLWIFGFGELIMYGNRTRTMSCVQILWKKLKAPKMGHLN
jgi:hypothetical protein